jgi:hypothetical protein
MDLVDRVQGIILKPKEEWEKIKSESLTVSELFTSYAMILVAIPAIAQLIGYGIVGFKVPFVGWYRLGLGAALARAILAYILTLGSVFLLGFIINALAPSFASKQGQENAMKLAVFSMTPAWLAGILYIITPLAPLALLASLYGIYLLYLGVSAGIMETPKEKVVSYLVVVVVVSLILILFVSFILGAIFAVGVSMGAV